MIWKNKENNIMTTHEKELYKINKNELLNKTIEKERIKLLKKITKKVIT